LKFKVPPLMPIYFAMTKSALWELLQNINAVEAFALKAAE
jgi:hypothetical protein